MTIRVFEGNGAAKRNELQEIVKAASIGPATFVFTNQGESKVIAAFKNQRTGLFVQSDKSTVVSAEDTTYDGNGALVDFTGASLAETPIVPASLIIVDAGTAAPNLIDKYGDGKLYTDDVDLDEAGVIDYFSGAIALSYPVGKEPTGQLDADYYYQAAELVRGGKMNFLISNVIQNDTIIAYAACDNVKGSRVKVDGIATGFDKA